MDGAPASYARHGATHDLRRLHPLREARSCPSHGSEDLTGKPQVDYWGHWAVTESGLYLLDADAEPRPTIEFYSFATRRMTPVLSLEQKPSYWEAGLSASRDGRTVFYSQVDPQSVIKMVENFR
jgi:hypothetical protein